MSMRPDGADILRGVCRSLQQHILPELGSAYAQAQVQYALILLEGLAREWDGVAQRLVDDNADMRNIAGHLSWHVEDGDPALAQRLRVVADDKDANVRLKTLTAANDDLRGLLARVLAGGLVDDAAMQDDIRAALLRGVMRRAGGGVA